MSKKTVPNLAGVASTSDVSSISTGRFAKDYINWARVMNYVRDKAPGWLPYFERTSTGDIHHQAPDGSHYILVGFTNIETGLQLPPIPHGQDLGKGCSGRDIADASMRGVCKAAALQLGLAWSMWSKDDPMEREKSSSDSESAASFDVKTFEEQLLATDSKSNATKLVDANLMNLRKLDPVLQKRLRKIITSKS